jgi:hypothetical protein
VSPRYLYALLDAEPAAPIGVGLAGEPLQIIGCAGIYAATGDMREAPTATPDALRGHDAVVRRLATLADAVLPARFGTLATDEGDLRERLARTSGSWPAALARVAGREQMILRVYSRSPAPGREETPPPVAGGGPGAAYLAERARRLRAATDIAELESLRDVLVRFVIEERLERHDTPPLVASAYHLIARGQASEYTAAVEQAAAAVEGMRVRVSGPWAPYAFAPDMP